MIPNSPINDETVRAASEGDADQHALLVGQMADAVRAMVVVRLAPSPKQSQDVDDLVQDSLSAVSSGISTLREPAVATLRAFASTVVSRKVAQYLAKSDGRQRAGHISLESQAGEGSNADVFRNLLSASGLSPRGDAVRREQIARLLIEIANLKESQRDIITMAMIDQLPITEVAKRMDISRPAASMLLFRAMKTLRRNMTGSSEIGEADESRP